MPTSDQGREMKIVDCNAVRERLPWFVRDTLAADERAAVAAHLEACAACRDELAATRRALWIASRHLPGELLADYGAGLDLGDWPRELVESHLAHCADCREDLALETAEIGEAPAPLVRLHRAASGAAWRPLALAASLVAAVAAGWLGARWSGGAGAPEPRPPVAAAALLELTPESARLRADAEVPALPTAPLPVAVVLHTDLVTDAVGFRLRVLASDGALLHTAANLAPDAAGGFVVLLRPDDWPAGELRLELEVAAAGGWAAFESYRLRLPR